VSGRGSTSVEIARDPFEENGGRTLRWRARVLGASFEFTSNSRELLGIAKTAFADLPPHRLSRSTSGLLQVHLHYTRDRGATPGGMPPQPVLSSGSGWLCGHIDARNFMIADPRGSRAVVHVGDALLAHPRLLRYELIEFAAITLATRVQPLVSLHAGCVGGRGRGVLLLGSSGAGKSTFALHAALGGLDFLSEDSVFVDPETLEATGLSAFVHARDDSIPLIDDRRARRHAASAPCIERRSGARKREIDLRSVRARLAPKPLRIVAALVLSAQPGRDGSLLTRVSASQLRRVLRAEQSYAMGQPGWAEFEKRLLKTTGFQLHRAPPAMGVAAVRELLDAGPA